MSSEEEWSLYGGAHRGGKVTRARRALLEHLGADGHVHYAGHEGMWCVTGTQVGPLWELLARPQPRDITTPEYDLY